MSRERQFLKHHMHQFGVLIDQIVVGMCKIIGVNLCSKHK